MSSTNVLIAFLEFIKIHQEQRRETKGIKN